jgi:hypothetical protein
VVCNEAQRDALAPSYPAHLSHASWYGSDGLTRRRTRAHDAYVAATVPELPLHQHRPAPLRGRPDPVVRLPALCPRVARAVASSGAAAPHTWSHSRKEIIDRLRQALPITGIHTRARSVEQPRTFSGRSAGGGAAQCISELTVERHADANASDCRVDRTTAGSAIVPIDIDVRSRLSKGDDRVLNRRTPRPRGR